jgi:hypothetical protein
VRACVRERDRESECEREGERVKRDVGAGGEEGGERVRVRRHVCGLVGWVERE